MKKILSLMLAVIMSFALVACGGQKAAKFGNTQADAPKLVMCTNAEFPPYEYKDGAEYKGIDIDIIDAIGKKLGYSIEVMDIAFDATLPAVMSGKADFAMSGMTVTEDRLENVDFTHTYQTAIQAVVVSPDSDIKSIEDMYGKKIGVIEGYTGDLYCTDDFGEDYVVRYPKTMDGFQALKVGKVDAFVIDDQVAKEIVAQDGGSFKVLDSAYAEEEYAIAVKKGNAELLEKLNSAIDGMKASGELQQIIDKYIAN